MTLNKYREVYCLLEVSCKCDDEWLFKHIFTGEPIEPKNGFFLLAYILHTH